ncbi:TMP-TENI-domain-containing protein [Lentithecium fluviatile CBS 122367]|uniref:TMP-TENI-domain-containing protein n=1 Tax=Lentithecium fluviatile CBS 122367 TaxID=1168545 RepID=A0A6G1II47_9PLEO|nr:TMP-TENI-domain-containing protein [Lentithecium fluviatile CBS 122367]
MKPQVEYSLYLVTDSTEALLGDRDLVEVVEQALLGGVTIVQYRDKTSDTGDLVATATALHEKCKLHNIPLVINDRVDVALAVGCEGVHLGQDDMDVASARAILGPDRIIGATVSSIEEARKAVERGADYLGIGTLYATNTKKNTKDIIGINGIRKILKYLDDADEPSQKVKTVCIGGVNASNLQRVLYQLYAPSSLSKPKTIDGVAVVSAIIGVRDPRTAASHLRSLIASPHPFAATPQPTLDASKLDDSTLKQSVIRAVKAVHETSPLSHNMTNLVVQNISANIALAIGASPIMSNNGAEAPDLAKLGGGLVINMGTVTPEALSNHRKAIEAYNAAGGPVVLDPVGAGATSARKEALTFLLASGYFDLIKGNEREIMAVARASGFTLDDTTQQRGVDSGTSLFSTPQKAYIVSRIALRERTIVLMTGAVDLISNGTHTLAIANGHPYLGMVTGSGCSLGTTISAYLAANKEGKFLAAVAGLLHYEIAAEDAAKREDVRGPGTFIPAFIDELYLRRVDVVEGRKAWVDRVKVEVVEPIGDFGLLREA